MHRFRIPALFALAAVLTLVLPAASSLADEPSVPACAAASLAEPADEPAGDLLPVEPIAMSPCTDACADDYFSCLDDCAAWPYPGCETDCRNGYNACRLGCFPG